MTTSKHATPSCTETDQIQPFMLTAFLVEAMWVSPTLAWSIVCFFRSYDSVNTQFWNLGLTLQLAIKGELWTRMGSTPGPTSSIASVMVLAKEMVRVLICPCHQFINDYTEWGEPWYGTWHQRWRDAQRLQWLRVDRCSLSWASGRGLLEVYQGWTDAASAGDLEEVY